MKIDMEHDNRTKEFRLINPRLIDWESIKDHVYPMVISPEVNKELPETLVSTPLLDLAVIYLIRLNETNIGFSSTKVTKDLFLNFGIGINELHDQAVRNLENDGYTLRSLFETIQILGGVPAIEANDIELLVLTNRSRTFGAAGILNKHFLQEHLHENYYIIPSSVHELILVPINTDNEATLNDLNNMIVSVNSTIVNEQYILSDHAYFYDHEANEVRMCM